MKKIQKSKCKPLHNILIFIGIIAVCILICLLLSSFFQDNNLFATPLFILAVALVSRYTDGYCYGIIASVIGVFCVNYMFTYPFWEFNFWLYGYPLTFAVMLLVSIIVSTLTTQIKKQEYLKMEAEKEKMHANLLRSVSHDIRTPLTSILGASSALLENQNLDCANRTELIHEINEDAQWLIRIVENILSVTRFSTNEVTLKKVEEVVEEVVGSAIIKFKKNFSAIDITVEQPEEILLVPMDAVLIEQVLINLFENAAKHGQNVTEIHLTIKKEAHAILFDVADNGIGIPENILPHMFDGYIELSRKQYSDNQRNMGIGLSVCFSIIHAHGGQMEAMNNQYGGATFRFSLPTKEES